MFDLPSFQYWATFLGLRALLDGLDLTDSPSYPCEYDSDICESLVGKPNIFGCSGLAQHTGRGGGGGEHHAHSSALMTTIVGVTKQGNAEPFVVPN